mgnify:CR=1 FL=1
MHVGHPCGPWPHNPYHWQMKVIISCHCKLYGDQLFFVMSDSAVCQGSQEFPWLPRYKPCPSLVVWDTDGHMGLSLIDERGCSGRSNPSFLTFSLINFFIFCFHIRSGHNQAIMLRMKAVILLSRCQTFFQKKTAISWKQFSSSDHRIVISNLFSRNCAVVVCEFLISW